MNSKRALPFLKPAAALLGVALAILWLTPGAAEAQDSRRLAYAALPVDVPIDNPGFEADSLSPGGFDVTITDWQTSHPVGQGVYRPTVGSPGSDYPGGIPEGLNVGFSNGTASQIWQVLGTTLEAYTRYVLTVEIGWNGNDPFDGYIVQLRAGDHILAEDDSSHRPRQGSFITSRIETTVGPDHPEIGEPLEIRLRATGIQTNFDDVRLTAEPVGACAETLLVPSYLVDRNDASGTNTLFAVRNLTDAARSVDIEYYGLGGGLQRTDTETLAAFETRTVSIRDVPGLGTGPDGFARGFVKLVTTGAPDRSPVLGGDFFQVDVADDFATGETMVRGGDLCADASIRFLDFGAGTRLTIYITQPRGVEAGDPPSFTVQPRDEAGAPAGGPISVFTAAHSVELAASDLTTADFGSLDFDFSNSLGGVVYAEYSAHGRFSVGVASECKDSRPCDSGDCCPAGAAKATLGGLHYPKPEFTSCAEAIDAAVRALGSFHYRNTCQETYGGPLPDAVLGVRVVDCEVDPPLSEGNVVVAVEVCCPEP